MVDDDWLYFVDDDWLHFVGFIIYGFVSTSAHFDSIWFNPIQFGFILFSVSSCIEFHKRLVFVCFIGVLRGSDGAGWARDGAGVSWWLMDGGRLAGGLWCWDLCGSVVWIWPMIMGAHWSCVSMCKSEWVAVTRWVIVCAHIVSPWFAHFNGFWSFDTLFFVFFFGVADHLLVGSVRFGSAGLQRPLLLFAAASAVEQFSV